MGRLTPREREILDLVVEGLSSKEIASRLTVSFKTVEAHRAKVMRKMEAESVAQLVRIVVSSNDERMQRICSGKSSPRSTRPLPGRKSWGKLRACPCLSTAHCDLLQLAIVQQRRRTQNVRSDLFDGQVSSLPHDRGYFAAFPPTHNRCEAVRK